MYPWLTPVAGQSRPIGTERAGQVLMPSGFSPHGRSLSDHFGYSPDGSRELAGPASRESHSMPLSLINAVTGGWLLRYVFLTP